MIQRIEVRTRRNDAFDMALTFAVAMAVLLVLAGRASFREPALLAMFAPLIVGRFSQSIVLQRVCIFLWVGIASGVVVLSSFR